MTAAWHRRAVVLGVALVATLPGRGTAGGGLRLRASAEVARVLAGVPGASTGVEIEIGDPASTSGADVVVGYADALRRSLDSGRADDRDAVSLGTRPTDGMPLLAVAVSSSSRRAEAGRFLQRLAAGAPPVKAASVSAAARFAGAIVRWWMPACSLERNSYTDPNEVLGGPNASSVIVNAHRQYRGLISLGQGGYVVVDMGQGIVDRGGPEIRVHQYVADEPVTVYGGDSPNGPFKLVGFRRRCPGSCDFDFADAGLASARYVKVEDGEYYPCLDSDTDTEGADVDAIELLNQ